ncbi:MAG: TatD family hydrolase [Kiritimatiellia bacterium]|nr:TatD family hydrolase [Kiritimatiellia bacterium]
MNRIFMDPHIHMYSRTTDDYMRMHGEGIRVVVEPSFWLGAHRRYAGTFWDYFQLILDFEAERSKRFGIDHYACVAVNPKEAEVLELALEVLDGMGPYLDHPRCVALGEIGFNRITPNEEEIFQRQLEMAKARNMLILIHTPHDTAEVRKRDGVARTLDILRELNYDESRIIVDHNTEDTMDLTRKTGVWAGMTVYPYSKLNPERVVHLVQRWGLDRMLINSSADWGASDPTSIPKVAEFMRREGFQDAQIEKALFSNPMDFYRQCPKFQPNLEIPFVHPSVYQR